MKQLDTYILEKIRDDLMKLEKDDWKGICTGILIANGEEITITKSGVTFCLMSLSQRTLEQIQQFISHKNELTSNLKKKKDKGMM